MKNKIRNYSTTQVKFVETINDIMSQLNIEKEDVINITMIGQFAYLWYWSKD